ncbi:putative testis-specific Y-encoded-like protein 2 [Sesbania bispinosa]|nr:putative testis-specific Y-encoded-like protein 2 [Sesbania bispinosa]
MTNLTEKLRDDEVQMKAALAKEAEDGWDKSVELYFHTAIDQIKFMNLLVEINTRGMDTMYVARNGKWYRVHGDGWCETSPSGVKRVPPPEKDLVIAPAPEVPVKEIEVDVPTKED